MSRDQDGEEEQQTSRVVVGVGRRVGGTVVGLVGYHVLWNQRPSHVISVLLVLFRLLGYYSVLLISN